MKYAFGLIEGYFKHTLTAIPCSVIYGACIYKWSDTKRAQIIELVREDRLSNLPIDILYHMLSYLDATDVVRTCALGKNWRNIWRSVPSLKFGFNVFLVQEPHLWLRYSDCLSKFWVFLFWTVFMRQAPQQNVKELQFEARFSVEVDPFSVAFVKSLSASRLHYDTAFGNLKSLRLVTVYFNDAKITEKLFTNCGVLENLSLEYCRMQRLEVLNISAPNLKKFTFLNKRCNEIIPHLFYARLNMHAPYLVNFCYNGPLIFWEFSNMTSVNHVEIDVSYDQSIVLSEPKLGANVSTLKCAKDLSLPSIVPLYLSTAWARSVCYFPNTRSLRLGMECTACSIEGLINLLRLTPNLEILYIKFMWGCMYKRKYRDENMACLSHHLKEVKITVSRSCLFSVEFVKFLLQNAKVLEKFHIRLEQRDFDPKQFNALQTINLASKTVALFVSSVSASGEENVFSLHSVDF